eukprot:2523690-Rhodomonas_salina.1
MRGWDRRVGSRGCREGSGGRHASAVDVRDLIGGWERRVGTSGRSMRSGRGVQGREAGGKGQWGDTQGQSSWEEERGEAKCVLTEREGILLADGGGWTAGRSMRGGRGLQGRWAGGRGRGGGTRRF